ncbi:MAG: hypothetical protein KGY38_03465 [Desulfobacterales bacterium]|nr:hypothetical protein [Desulfobacterales bacterium]
MSKNTNWGKIKRVPLQKNPADVIYDIIYYYYHDDAQMPNTFLLTYKKKVIALGKIEEEEVIYSDGGLTYPADPHLIWMRPWDPFAHFWIYRYFKIKKIRRTEMFEKHFPGVEEGRTLFEYFVSCGHLH